jgi:hypothetical protein
MSEYELASLGIAVHPRAGLKELNGNAIRVDHVDAAAFLRSWRNRLLGCG